MPNDNVKSYIRNLGKSLNYTVKTTVASNMPILAHTVSSNSEVMKTGSNYVKNMLTQKKSGTNAINNLVTKYLSDIETIKNNAFDDLRTGKINNFDRAANEQMKALGMDFDIDWGDDFDMSELDENGQIDGETPDIISTATAIRNSAKVNEIGSNFRTKMLVDAVSNSSEASTRYLGRTQSKMTALLLNSQAQIHTEQMAMMENTNKLLTSIFQFQNETMVAHMDKQLSFYDNILSEVRELKEAIVSDKRGAQRQSTSKRSIIEEIFGSDGSINLQAYGKNVKRNASDMLASTGLGMLGTMSALGGGPMQMIKNNPLGLVTNLIVSGMMPKSMKSAMKNLDTSISGLFGTLVLSLNSAKNDLSKSTSSQLLAQLLGVNFDEKTSINVGKYVRDAVPYTGKSDKALTEVIPTLLSHILSEMKGGTDVAVYDYTTGKFTTTRSVIKDTKDRIKSAQMNNMYDVRSAMSGQMSKMKGGSSKQAQDDLDNFIQFLASSSYMFNPKTDKDFEKLKRAGLNLSDPRMYNVLRAAFMSMPKSTQSSVNMKRILGKANMSGTYMNIEDNLFETGLSAAYSGLDGIYSTAADKKAGRTKSPTGKGYKKNSEFESLVNQPFESMQTVMAAFDDTSKMFKAPGSDSFFKSLMAQKNFGKRVKMLKDKIGSPAQMISGMINKLDTLVYRIIYGKDDDGKSSDDGDEPPSKRNSIIGRFTIGFNKAMGKAMNFIDDKVLTPMHEKFFGEKGLFTNMQNKFKGSMKDKIMDKTSAFVKYLMGEKKDGHYTGGALSEFGNTFVDAGHAVKSLFTGSDYTRSDGTTVKGNAEGSVNSYIKKYMKSLTGMIGIGLFGSSFKGGKETAFGDNGKGLLNSIFDGIKDIASVFSNAKGNMSDETKKNITDWGNELKGFLPKGVASGLMGGAAGLFMGNPLLGALMGTTIGFAAHSKKFRTYLFGDEESDGIVPKKYVDMFKKYVPSTIAGGLIGGAASLVLPGGAMLGVLMGSAIGFAKQSSEAQKFLFGDEELGKEGFIPKKYVDGYKKYFPTMAGGALLGLVGSAVLPGGPLLGITLGAALGYAHKSSKFQEYLFGKEADEDGNGATNGLLGKEVKKNLGKIVGGGTLGMILGMMGMPGGPLAGAMLGSALGYASRTEKFKKFIFGDKEDVSNKGMKDILKKYAPQIGGGVLGLLNVIPGGPIGGLMIGGAVSWLTKTSKFKELMYGSSEDENGNESRNITKFVKKHFPLIAGGVLGAVGGLGFGILPGILMGGAINWLSKSDKVKSMIFGKEDENGNIKNGLLPFLKKNYKIPAGVLLGMTGAIPGGPIGGLLLGTAVNFATKTDDLKNLIFGEKDADGNQIKKNMFQRLKGLAPSIAGVILSTMGAIPGGPIAGLLVGSAFGIIQQTDNLQNFLFGKEMDENGKPTSNIILALKKYSPIIAGGLAGTLGTLGFGPIAGMLIGTAAGWVAKTDAMKNFLFGEKDEDGNRIRKTLSQKLKVVPGLAGGILGAMGVIPGGPLAGMLIGSALSFITSTGNLKTAIFGEKDVDGKTVKKSLLQRLPGIAPGAIGALLGQFAGLGFGPITGMLIGSAVGWVAQSQTMREIIFGKTDKDGNKVKPNLFQRIKKFLPMGIGGAVFGLASSILPGGPIIGMLVGATVQWVAKSSIFQDLLFGKSKKNESTDPEKQKAGFMSKIKKIIPFGKGFSSVLTGGIVSNLMLGSALSFAKRIGSFGDMLLGKKDSETGTRSGGLANMLKSGALRFGGMFRRGASASKSAVDIASDSAGEELVSAASKRSVLGKAGSVAASAFRGIGSFFKRFVSNTKQVSTIPKVMFLNRMLQNVKDKASYDTTMLGLIHQIAVNTVGGTGAGGPQENKPGFSWAGLLEALGGIGTGVAALSFIKDFLNGDKGGMAKTALRWAAKRFTQPIFNIGKKLLNTKGGQAVLKTLGKGFGFAKGLAKKGLSVIGGGISNIFEALNPGKTALSSADDVLEEVVERAGGKAVSNAAADTATDILAKSASKAAKNTLSASVAKTLKAAGSNTIIRGIKTTAEKIVTDDSMVGKFVTKLTKLLTNPKLVKAFGKFGAAIAKHVPKIVSEITEKVAKAGAKILGKVALHLNLVVSIGFLVYDFTTGMAECKNVFQLPATADPTLGMRVASGLGKMISGIVYSLISPKFFAELIYDIIGSDDEQLILKEQQERAKADLERYNAYTGYNLSMDEYQSKLNTTVGGKVWNFFTGKKSGLEQIPDYNAAGYYGGTSAGGRSHSSSGGSFGTPSFRGGTSAGGRSHSSSGGKFGDPTPGMRGVNKLNSSSWSKLNKLRNRRFMGDPSLANILTDPFSKYSNPGSLVLPSATILSDSSSDGQFASKYAYALDTKKHPKSDVTIADLRMVEALSKEYGVPAHLWWALVDHESDFYSKALGGSNDTGWGQIIPSTGKWLYKTLFGSNAYLQPDTAFDKETNARMSMYYLRTLYDKRKNWLEALSMYNTGSNPYRTVYSGGVADDYRRNTGMELTPNLLAPNPSGTNMYSATNNGVITPSTADASSTGVATFISSLASRFSSAFSSVFDIGSLSSGIAAMFGGLDPFTGTLGNAVTALGGTDETTNTSYINEALTAYPKLKGDADSHDFILQRLAALAGAYGKDIDITSGYRSVEEQQYLYDKWFDDHPQYDPNTEEGQKARSRMIAKPGTSMHNLGMAADIGSSWIRNMSNSTLQKYGLYKPMDYENWHVEPIETQLYGRKVSALANKFGTPFTPSADKNTFISSDFRNIGDPLPGINGVPDATDYSNKMTDAVKSLSSDSGFNAEVIKILRVISASLSSLVSISSDNAAILSSYIQSLAGSGGASKPSVAIISQSAGNNNNPYTNKATTTNTRQSKTSAITAIAVGSPS